MEGELCPYCGIGFEGVPKEQIFDSGCKCTDSKFHAGCINQIYEHIIENSITQYKCPTCLKYNIPIKKMKIFINIAKGKSIPQQNNGSLYNLKQCILCPYYFLKTCLGPLTNGEDTGSNTLLMFVTISWFIYIHVEMERLFREQYKIKTTHCDSLPTNTTKEYSIYKDCVYHADAFKIYHYVPGIFIGSTYLSFMCSFIGYFAKNLVVIEPIISIITMICICILWRPLSRVKFYNKASGIPSIYTFVLNLIGLSVTIVLSIIFSVICEIKKECNVPNDGITRQESSYLKTGYDYEDELEKAKTEELDKSDNIEDHVVVDVQPNSITGDITNAELPDDTRIVLSV